MAYTKFSNVLQKGSTEGLAYASDIAYEVSSTTTSLGGVEITTKTMTKSVADALDDLYKLILSTDSEDGVTSLKEQIETIQTAISNLGTTADKITYTNEADSSIATVLDALDKLVGTDIGSPAVEATYYSDVDTYNAAKGTSLTGAEFNALPLSDKVKTPAVEATGIYKLTEDAKSYATTATNQATLALNAANSAATSLSSISTEKTKAISEIKELQNTIQDNLTQSLTKIDSTSELTEKLINAFNISGVGEDGKANFVLLTLEAYNAMESDDSLQENVVYFVYESDDTDDQYCTISVSVNNTTMGYVTGGGSFKKNVTDNVILLAAPKTGYSFGGWTLSGSNDVLSTDAQYKFTASENASYIATFYTPDTYYVALVSANTGGTAAIENAAEDNKYVASTLLKFTATPASHYSFKNWTVSDGSTVSTKSENPTNYQIIKNISYIANFEEDPKYTITATCNATQGTVQGTATVYQNETVTLTATPLEGYTFVNWTVDNTEVSTEATYTVTATADSTYTANFIVSES